MVSQRVSRRSGAARWAFAAVETAAILFALIFFSVLIEYTETAFRIVPLRALQLAVSIIIALGADRLRRLLGTVYEYRLEPTQISVRDARKPKQLKPLWNLDPDGIRSWGRVNTGAFSRLLEDKELKRHPYFIHRGAELYYIHYVDFSGEGLMIFEPDEHMLEGLRGVAAHRETR